MKAILKLSDKLTLEFDASGQKELFEELAKTQEIFAHNTCGACGGTDLKFIVRVVDDNKFYEIGCTNCGCKLAFGQHKKGGTLFPKTKDDEGKWLKNKGWTKYIPPTA